MAASGAPGSVDEGSGVAHGVTSRAASDRSGAAQQLEPVSAERLQSLKDESRPLRLSPTLSEHLQNVEISPEEGFLLSRIDGSSRAREILSLSPMPEPDSAGALIELLNKGLIYWGGSANSNVVRKKAQPTEKAKPNGALDAQVLAELDRHPAPRGGGRFRGSTGSRARSAGKRAQVELSETHRQVSSR